MMRRYGALVLSCGLLAAGCAGDSRPDTTTQVREVVGTYVGALIDGERAGCAAMTASAREQLAEQAGMPDRSCADALTRISRLASTEGDLAQARDDLRRALPTVTVTVDGDHAHASGGELDGERYLPPGGIDLIREDGRWKVASVSLS